MSKRLNDIVPYPTIIKVLLRKIKLQEEEIERLRTEIERPCELIKGIPDREAKKLSSNPYYRAMRSDFHKVERKLAEMKKDEERLMTRMLVAEKIVADYFSH